MAAEPATLDHEHDHDDPGGPAAQAVTPDPGTSLMDGLVAQREAIANERETVLPVAHFDGRMGVHYQLLPWEETNKYAKRVQNARDPKDELEAGAALIARACLGVLVPDPAVAGLTRPEDAPATWGWKSIDPEGGPCRFSSRLAELFRLPPLPDHAKSADVVRLIFANDYAVSAHSGELLRWMQGENASVNRDFAEG